MLIKCSLVSVNQRLDALETNQSLEERVYDALREIKSDRNRVIKRLELSQVSSKNQTYRFRILCAGWDWEYSETNLEITVDDNLIVVAEGFHTDDEFFFQVESNNRCMVYGMRMSYGTGIDVVYENDSPSIEDGHTEYTYQFNQDVSDVWSAIHRFLNESNRNIVYRICGEKENGSKLWTKNWR